MTGNHTGTFSVHRGRRTHPRVAVAASHPVRARKRPPGPDTRSAIRILGGHLLPAVFCVHSSTGGIAEFVGLAQHLGPGQQLFGLQSRGMVDDEPPLSTVGEMAAAYLEDVRLIQPHGPYLFAAWSMGCYIAVEMGRQAADLGHEVAGIFLIAPPHGEERSRWKRRTDWRAARRDLERLDQKITAAADPARRTDLLPLWDLNDDPLRDPHDHGDALAGEAELQRLRAERTNLANVWAGIRYRTGQLRRGKPYPGPATLFVPQHDDADGRQDLVAEWRRMLQVEAEVVPTPGTHWTVIEGAGAAVIGERLRTEVANRGSGSRRHSTGEGFGK